MKKIFSLSKVMLKNVFGAQFNDKKELTKSKKILRAVGMLIFVVYLVGITFFMTRSAIASLKEVNQESMLIFSSLTGLSIFLFVTLTMSIPTILYFSQDTESILPLPLTPREILSAKLVTVYITGLSSLAFFYLPLGINYFFQVESSLLFLIKFILVGFLLPIIPVMVASLIIVFLFSYFPKVNNKDLFTYVSSILLFVIIFASGFTSGYSPESGGFVGAIINSDGPLINSVNSFVPTIPMFARFITQTAPLQGLLGLALTAVVTIVALLIMERLYFMGLLASNEESKPEKKLSKKQVAQQFKTRSPQRALLKADLRNIFRTPALAINYLLVLIILPFAFAFPGFMVIKEVGFDKIWEGLDMIQFALLEVDTLYIILAVMIISMSFSYFISSMSTIASTSFSREGENMLNYKIMPVDMMSLVHSKILVANLITAIPGMIIAIVALSILKMNVLYYPLAIISVLLATNLTTLEGLLIDTLSPKLVWEDVTQALKQNFMATIPIFSTFLVVGLSGYMLFQFPRPLTAMMIILVVIFIELALYFYIKKKSVHKLIVAIEEL